ncbi:hypothetical protein H0B56_03360 [Haloechinothrix sp. YIM 98757]|uniref:Uncharacterized protein n=1 Tax=Haloechinothrix aidingensis TaxID=2752311 RepID=A0A838A0G3_9PSEU|nr:hypothetical protein [Haloechinothrix aidingensis]MBA0124573.1 hypothetical protein [Haloechinothrix aidingensis]
MLAVPGRAALAVRRALLRVLVVAGLVAAGWMVLALATGTPAGASEPDTGADSHTSTTDTSADTDDSSGSGLLGAVDSVAGDAIETTQAATGSATDVVDDTVSTATDAANDVTEAADLVVPDEPDPVEPPAPGGDAGESPQPAPEPQPEGSPGTDAQRAAHDRPESAETAEEPPETEGRPREAVIGDALGELGDVPGRTLGPSGPPHGDETANMLRTSTQPLPGGTSAGAACDAGGSAKPHQAHLDPAPAMTGYAPLGQAERDAAQDTATEAALPCTSPD